MATEPPEEAKPRISYSVWPGPAVRNEMPGMAPTRSWIDVIFCSERSPALRAVIAIGVAWTVDSRFSAVTTISSKPEFSALELAGAAPGPAEGSARADAHTQALIITAVTTDATTREALPSA